MQDSTYLEKKGHFVQAAGRGFGVVTFPGWSGGIFWKIWPLPLIYTGNMLFGLGSTQSLSLPMLTVLRRLSILLTMVAEHLFLGVQLKTEVKLSVYLMIFGAAVAASNDLAFDLTGYAYIMMNNISTAANVVYVKKKLDAKSLGWFLSQVLPRYGQIISK